MAVHVARNQENKLNIVKVPIIFVPGVMATRLVLTLNIKDSGESPNRPEIPSRTLPSPMPPDQNASNKSTVKQIRTESNKILGNARNWDPDDASMMVALAFNTDFRTKKQILNSSKSITIIKDSDALKGRQDLDSMEKQLLQERGFGAVASEHYLNFLVELYKHFDKDGMPIYVHPYDWRQSNYDSGQILANRILNEILPAENAKKCIIVTHSMGGFVTRAALKSSPDLEAKTMGVIHAFQPVNGAVAFYRRCFTGTTLKHDSSAWRDLNIGEAVAGAADKILFESALENLKSTGITPLQQLKSLGTALGNSKGKSILTDKIFGLIIGSTPTEFSEVVGVLRGPVELIPTDNYISEQKPDEIYHKWIQTDVSDIFGDSEDKEKLENIHFHQSDTNDPKIQKGSIFNDYAAFMCPIGIYNFYNSNQTAREELLIKLELAFGFHRFMAADDKLKGELYKHPNTFALAGTGLETDTETHFDLRFKTVADIVYREKGIIRTLNDKIPPPFPKIPDPTELPLIIPVPGSSGAPIIINRRHSPLKDVAVPSERVDWVTKWSFVFNSLRKFDEINIAEITQPIKGAGDMTVPYESACGLFPEQKNISADTFDPWKNAKTPGAQIRQFTISGAEHSTCYSNSLVSSTVTKMLEYIRATADMK